MFDRYVVEGSRYVPYEKTVHEHRAPTDASIKILDDMDERMRSRLAGMFNFSANDLNCCLMRTYLIPGSMSKQAWTLTYILNGVQKTVTNTVDTDSEGSLEKAINNFLDSITYSIKDTFSREIRDGVVKAMEQRHGYV